MTDCCAGPQVELVCVQRTHHSSAADEAVGQWPLSVRAESLGGMDLVIARSEDCNLATGNVERAALTARNAIK
jgi:hypothetical protein